MSHAVLSRRTEEALKHGEGKPRRVPGEPGLWVLLFGDMAVFAVLFGVYVHYRGQQASLFDRSQRELHQIFGAVNTLLLLTGSLCVITAVRAIRATMSRLGSAMIVAALFCACAFLVNKGLEWSDLLSHGHTPASNHFFRYFFVLTGLHAFHLLIGMGALVALLVLSRKESLSKGQLAFVEGGACFWHLVDWLWVVLFALLYLVR